MYGIPVKTLSRKPFLLMLQDDDGVLSEVPLDPSLVTSDTALIVLDEYNDSCWVWIGNNVNMPTRMHALRMARAVQKSGHQVGVTTIGRSTTKLIEMMEKEAGDPEVAANIQAFKELLSKRWKFEDNVLAYDEELAAQYEAAPVKIRDTATDVEHPSTKSAPTPIPKTSAPSPSPPKTRTVQPKASPAPLESLAEQKAAYLLYSVVKNSDLVYTERFERGGNMGIKIESPGTLVIEAILDGSNLRINPPEFGDNDTAKQVKADYESLSRNL